MNEEKDRQEYWELTEEMKVNKIIILNVCEEEREDREHWQLIKGYDVEK